MKKRKLLLFVLLLFLIPTIRSQDDNIEEKTSILITASQTTGNVPFTVQFTADVTGELPLSYEWDFDGDNKTDSTEQNASFEYLVLGEYNATATVFDGLGNNASESILITANLYEPQIKLVSCFPTKLILGENQVVCIISNNGDNALNNIAGKIVGIGLQHMSSTGISSLYPKDQDSINLKVNVLQAGNRDAVLKIGENNFPISFEIMEEIKYSEEELGDEFNNLKEQFNKQESIYYEKKADGYPVSEIFESMKIIQGQIRTIQQQLLTNELQQARINMDILNLSLIDLEKDLENIKKPKVTLLMWMKENALAITAIIAALGTLSGLLIKLLGHAKKVKEHAQKINLPKKFSFKNKKEEAKEEKSN